MAEEFEVTCDCTLSLLGLSFSDDYPAHRISFSDITYSELVVRDFASGIFFR